MIDHLLRKCASINWVILEISIINYKRKMWVTFRITSYPRSTIGVEMFGTVLETVRVAPFGGDTSNAIFSSAPGLSEEANATDSTTCSPISMIVLLFRFTVQ